MSLERVNYNSEVKTYKLTPEEIAEKFKNVKPEKKPQQFGLMFGFDYALNQRYAKKKEKEK